MGEGGPLPVVPGQFYVKFLFRPRNLWTPGTGNLSGNMERCQLSDSFFENTFFGGGNWVLFYSEKSRIFVPARGGGKKCQRFSSDPCPPGNCPLTPFSLSLQDLSVFADRGGRGGWGSTLERLRDGGQHCGRCCGYGRGRTTRHRARWGWRWSGTARRRRPCRRGAASVRHRSDLRIRRVFGAGVVRTLL